MENLKNKIQHVQIYNRMKIRNKKWRIQRTKYSMYKFL